MADLTMTEVFGPLLRKRTGPNSDSSQATQPERPTKAGKQNDGGKGRGHQRKGRERYGNGTRGSQQQGQGQNSGISKETLRLVTRALIHQQEAIDTLRLSTGWVWWLRIPEPSVVPTLVQAAEVWREQVVLKDSKIQDTPLRQALFWSMMQFLRGTLETMTEANLKLSKDSGWVNEQGHWVFQRWNPELKALEVDPNKSALTHETLMKIIVDIQSLTHRETLSRFHVLKSLEPEMEGQTVRVMMDIALWCPEADRMFQQLSALQGNAALQIVGLQFRRSTMQRSPVIKQLMENVFG